MNRVKRLILDLVIGVLVGYAYTGSLLITCKILGTIFIVNCVIYSILAYGGVLK